MIFSYIEGYLNVETFHVLQVTTKNIFMFASPPPRVSFECITRVFIVCSSSVRLRHSLFETSRLCSVSNNLFFIANSSEFDQSSFLKEKVMKRFAKFWEVHEFEVCKRIRHCSKVNNIIPFYLQNMITYFSTSPRTDQ